MMNKAYDVILVLGAQVKKEGIASETLKRRMLRAYEIYQQRQMPIICCGGQGADEPSAEGDFMCDWFQKKGAAPSMLYSENRSVNTDENIRYAKELMQKHGFSFALVVTSDYHLRRALAICRRYGVKAIGQSSQSVPAYFIKNYGRELLAWIKFYLRL